MKCYKCLPCYRGVCCSAWKPCRWQIDSSCALAEKATDWQQPWRWKQTLLARNAVMVIIPLYDPFLHRKSCYRLSRNLKDSFLSSPVSGSVCDPLSIYVCALRCPRGLMIVLEQNGDSEPGGLLKKQQINAYGAHTQWESVFSSRGERLSGFRKVEPDGKRLSKQRKAVKAEGVQFSTDYLKSQQNEIFPFKCERWCPVGEMGF